MNRQDITSLLWDSNIRIDNLIWLAANSSDICSELEEFLEFDSEEAKRLLGVEPPESTRDFEEYLSDRYNEGKVGYLVKAATPSKGEHNTYTWGRCNLKWFYFETWDEAAVTSALSEWAEKVRA